MQLKQVTTLDLSCPGCGFRIFNRRHPKCERCGSALPASLLLSEQERHALLTREQEQLDRELQQAKERRSRAAVVAPMWHPPLSFPGACDSMSTSSGTFGSGGGGVFDGGGACGSFGSEHGTSSGSDGG